MHLVVSDFDGTLASAAPGCDRPHTPKNLTDAWRVMDPSRVATDVPRDAMIQRLRNIKLYAGPNTKIWILTGRPESARQLTEAWLLVHGVPYDELIMLGDHRVDPVHQRKLEYLRQHCTKCDGVLSTDLDSVLLVDDDPKMQAVCEQLGIGFVNATEVT